MKGLGGAIAKEAGGMCLRRNGIKEAVENRIWGAVLGWREEAVGARVHRGCLVLGTQGIAGAGSWG